MLSMSLSLGICLGMQSWDDVQANKEEGMKGSIPKLSTVHAPACRYAGYAANAAYLKAWRDPIVSCQNPIARTAADQYIKAVSGLVTDPLLTAILKASLNANCFLSRNIKVSTRAPWFMQGTYQ